MPAAEIILSRQLRRRRCSFPVSRTNLCLHIHRRLRRVDASRRITSTAVMSRPRCLRTRHRPGRELAVSTLMFIMCVELICLTRCRARDVPSRSSHRSRTVRQISTADRPIEDLPAHHRVVLSCSDQLSARSAYDSRRDLVSRHCVVPQRALVDGAGNDLARSDRAVREVGGRDRCIGDLHRGHRVVLQFCRSDRAVLDLLFGDRIVGKIVVEIDPSATLAESTQLGQSRLVAAISPSTLNRIPPEPLFLISKTSEFGDARSIPASENAVSVSPWVSPSSTRSGPPSRFAAATPAPSAEPRCRPGRRPHPSSPGALPESPPMPSAPICDSRPIPIPFPIPNRRPLQRQWQWQWQRQWQWQQQGRRSASTCRLPPIQHLDRPGDLGLGRPRGHRKVPPCRPLTGHNDLIADHLGDRPDKPHISLTGGEALLRGWGPAGRPRRNPGIEHLGFGRQLGDRRIFVGVQRVGDDLVLRGRRIALPTEGRACIVDDCEAVEGARRDAFGGADGRRDQRHQDDRDECCDESCVLHGVLLVLRSAMGAVLDVLAFLKRDGSGARHLFATKREPGTGSARSRGDASLRRLHLARPA